MKNKNRSYALAYLGCALLGFMLPISRLSKQVPVREYTISLYHEFMGLVTVPYGLALGPSGFIEGITIVLAFIICIVLFTKRMLNKNYNKKLMVILNGILILLIIVYTVSSNKYAGLTILYFDKDLLFRYQIGYYLIVIGAIMSLWYNLKSEKSNY